MIIEKLVYNDSTQRITIECMAMDVATAIAKRSICPDGKRHGAVAIMDGRIIATGYNGPPIGAQHCIVCTLMTINDKKDWSTCPAVHAEVNVVANAARYGIQLNKCCVILTKKPCEKCLPVMINAGIETILYKED